MTLYVFVEEQEPSCDYGIGCGTRITEIDADNWNLAFEKFKEHFLGGDKIEDYKVNPLRSENAPDSLRVFVVTDEIDPPVGLWLREWDEAIATFKQKEKEQKEKEEYERLKKKYG